MTTAILDRIDTTSAILTASDGRCWDVYGDNWAELKADAQALAAFEGLTIELYNSELPEA
jgi:predicted component of type VI protein secretion system